MAEAEDRTQAPSERRLLRARDEGQAPLSRDLVVLCGLAAAALMLTVWAPQAARTLQTRLQTMLASPSGETGAALHEAAQAWFGGAFALLLTMAATGIAAVLLQTNFLVHGAALKPDLGRLSPRRGLMRIVGGGNLVEAAKSLPKLALLVWGVWSALESIWPAVGGATNWTAALLIDRIARELLHVLLLVLAAQAGVALLDVAWTRWRFSQRLRMSREDLKDEAKEADGDPKVKARLRQLRLLRSRRRMVAAVSKSTVVITNPTHYAVALSYERGMQAAPRVVAKGVDDAAARIRAAAAKAGVPLVANPPLARALYLVALDEEVPAEHFRVVAEVIAYVWRLRGAPGGH